MRRRRLTDMSRLDQGQGGIIKAPNIVELLIADKNRWHRY